MDRPEDRLALIECFERDGRAARVHDVWEWPVSLGRAMDNHVVIDDPYVAPYHLRLLPGPGGAVVVAVLDTVNGVRIDGVAHAAGARVPLPVGGATLQLGSGVLRVRLPGEALAPERLLPSAAMGHRLRTPLLLGVSAVLVGLEYWMGLDPGADATAWLPPLIGWPAMLLAWCGLWALMSKLFRHRFDFAGHLRCVMPWLVALQVADLVVPRLAGALGAVWLWQLSGPLQVVLAAALVRAQLLLLLPTHPRSVSAAVVAAVVAGSAVSLVLTHRSTDQWTRAPYMSTLPPAGAAWQEPQAPEELLQALPALAEALADRVRRAQAEDRDGSGD